MTDQVGSEDRRDANSHSIVDADGAGIESGRRSSVSDYDLLPEPTEEDRIIHNFEVSVWVAVRNIKACGFADPDEAEIQMAAIKSFVNSLHDDMERYLRETAEPSPLRGRP